jgi:hypothetical protein
MPSGKAVGGMDPTLTGIGGGIVVTALTAKVMIHTFSSGHRALSAARRRNMEIAEKHVHLNERRTKAELDAARNQVDLRSSVVDAELREFVQSVVRATATADFARSLERDQPLTDALAAALLDAWSVIEGYSP